MNDNAVVAVQEQAQVVEPVKPIKASDIRKQVNMLQDVMQSVMKKGSHYDVIPGAGDKPVLLKPGAEKIMMTFQLSGEPEITDLSDEDSVRYRVKYRLISPSGRDLGSGTGQCSTNEEKYKWRAAVCQEEFDETDSDRKRVKWRKGGRGRPPYKVNQVRTEPEDLANTVLKMAVKRAMTAAVLQVTAASDMFEQDIEELPPEVLQREQQGEGEPATSAVNESLNKAAAKKKQGKTGTGKTVFADLMEQIERAKDVDDVNLVLDQLRDNDKLSDDEIKRLQHSGGLKVKEIVNG